MRDYSRVIRLESYLPAVTDASSDIRETMYTENPELQKLWDEMCVILANQFITYMDQYSTSQWENILDITTLDTSLEQRKAEILKVLRGLRPYTYRSFKRILKTLFCDDILDVKLVNDKYELWITIDADKNYRVKELSELSERIVPLNLLIFIQELRESAYTEYIGFNVRSVNIFSADMDEIRFSVVESKLYTGIDARMISAVQANMDEIRFSAVPGKLYTGINARMISNLKTKEV